MAAALISPPQQKRSIALVLCLISLLVTATQLARAYVHPGIPMTVADLNQIKAKIQANEAPWSTGYSQLAGDGHSSLSYTMQGPFTTVSRNPNVNLTQWRNDVQAMWNLSLMWYFTSNSAYAQKARDILIAWANTQTSFGGMESALDLGDYSYKWAGAASILRGTWPGWTATDTTAVSSLFINVYWPGAGFLGNTIGPANKGTLAMVASTAIALFCDDTNKLNKVIYQMQAGASAGFPNTLTSGEVGETGRDQGHASGQWGMFALAAEMMYKQGLDVFSDADNRLLACGEYFSRWNEGVSTPFIPFGTTDQFYANPDTTPWGGGMPGLNLVYSAYCVRKGMQSPYLKQHRDAHPVDMDNFVFYKPADTATATPLPAFTFPSLKSATTGFSLNAEIGGATPAGNASYSGGVWTVTGGGTEIWNADSCHFSYKQLAGDFVFVAKVNAVQATSPYAKAGLMIRDTLNASTANRGWIAVTPVPAVEVNMVGEIDVYGGWKTASRAIPQSSYWIKIERLGQYINFYASQDGTSWACICAGLFYNMPSTAYVGFVVSSLNNGTLNTSTFSNVSITGGDGGNVTVPPAPFAVYASPGAGQVPLRWLQSFGATNYQVWRSTTSGGPYTQIASATNASYLDTSVAPDMTYYYVIKAQNSAGTSGNSPQDSATTAPAPPTPSGLMAFPGNARATLVWAGSSDATSYTLKRSTTSGSGYVTLTNVSVPNFVDTGLANGTTYYYVVSAGSGPSQSGDSAEASITPSVSATTALLWSGAVNGNWDTTTPNWLNAGDAATFANGNITILGDSGANTTVNLTATRTPAMVVVDNGFKSYSIGGSAIAGTGKLVKQGGGTLTLNAANTYSGGTAISNGVVVCGNPGVLGSGPLTLAGGMLVNNSGGQMTVANNIYVYGNNQVYLSQSVNIDLGGSTLQGNGTITWGWGGAGWSSIWVPRVNTMTGGTIIVPNTPNNFVRIDAAGCGNANVDWVIDENTSGHATLGFAGGTLSFGSLSGAGILDNQNNAGNTLSVGGNHKSTTFSGSLINANSLTLAKVGAGTLTLAGANVHSGPTTVSAGKLLLTTAATAKGNFTVANNATLGVTNISSASALVSNLTVAAGASLEFQKVTSTTIPLIVASNVTVSGSCTVKIPYATGLVAGSSYPLISYSGTFNGSFANLQLQMPYGWRGTLTQVGKQIVLANVAVVATTQPQVTATPGSLQLQLAWPATHTGWRLEAQTNSLDTGLGANWFPVSGSAATNQMLVPIDATSGSVFFRLVYP